MRHILPAVVIIVTIIFSLTACCTKKYCGGPGAPAVFIIYTGFADSELAGRTLYLQNKNTLQIEDSITEPYATRYDNLYSRNSDIRAYKYIIKFPFGRVDSITSVNYTEYTEEVKCNECFPAGNGYEDVTNYKDFSLTYNGAVYYNPDTLYISR